MRFVRQIGSQLDLLNNLFCHEPDNMPNQIIVQVDRAGRICRTFVFDEFIIVVRAVILSFSALSEKNRFTARSAQKFVLPCVGLTYNCGDVNTLELSYYCVFQTRQARASIYICTTCVRNNRSRDGRGGKT
jgi:hypothetical protein